MNHALLLLAHWLLPLAPAAGPGAGHPPRSTDRELSAPRVQELQVAATSHATYLTHILRLHFGQAQQVQHCLYQHLLQLDALTCPLTCPALASSRLNDQQVSLALETEEARYYQALSRVLTPSQYEALIVLDGVMASTARAPVRP